MSKLIALAGLATYVAQTPLQHDGTDYPVGAPLQLGPEAALPLLGVGAIAHADDNAAQVLQATGGTDGVAALLADLEQRDEQLRQARLQVEQLQQTVAELHQAAADQGASHEVELTGLRSRLTELTAANAGLQERLDKADADNADLRAELEKAAAAASTPKSRGK